MCNLYDIGRARGLAYRSPETIWEETALEALKKLDRTQGIRRTDPSLVLRNRAGSIEPGITRWGFERHFNNAINNARSDKLDGIWSDAWRDRRRCVIPLTTFYEWNGPTGSKQTFAFQAGGEADWLWAVGLWEDSPAGECFTMLTTAASPQVAPIHSRMPALLEAEELEPFMTRDNPIDLLESRDRGLSIFRCENPLKAPKKHDGPVAIDFLPGFG
ncbi:MAG: SOS response-associated peptidase family protein [Verrucomicrobiota bacterium]